MRIFRRISDILSANLNDLVDQWENPARMLRQAVRELEDALQQTRRSAVGVLADEKLLTRQLDRERSEQAAWLKRAEKAVRDGNEELARRALRHKLEHDKLAAALQDQQQRTAAAGAMLRRQLQAMHIKLADAKRRLAAAVAQRRALEAQHRLLHSGAAGGDAMGCFKNVAARLDRFEAETAALAEINDPLLEQLEEFQALPEDDLEEALTALKKQVQSTTP